MALSNVIKTDEANFDKLIDNTNKAVLVDFYADWCGPCKTLTPILDQLSKYYTKAVIVKVNVDENQNLAARFAIRSIPTLIVFKNRKQLETLMGVHTASQLEQKLKAYE
ncbi:thioredoxin [Francisella tularensis]|uniref:thioredoxin n=1 Tax=Francisella tularensis TaxID=263 RepID=UPI000173E5B5|nr:thioredoxin [Francisella tularensis]ACD30898.1 thioredoxin [Francisella tularensis subsp. mediasiatica FSC147]MBK2077830.1 thioredoxin [Francisella tularensis subsp. mediasiatica]MBK2101979.1 thioredoxin [Francisella tularensis subsp. mediasiatica]MBK2103957.1 thioredoxin [Francisella tularensis subsp. mediasiatica]MDN9003319.1 thioredoxin [Francisella tularensis subsp. mediasiatica]